jgi:hypothetical protein
MKKRTKQIDDDREVVLPFSIDGKQAYTTQGSIDMQGGEKEELSGNIRKQQLQGAIEKHVEAIMENSQRFVQATMWDIAGEKVRELMAECEAETIDDEGMEILASWINEKQFIAIQDGLKTIVKSKGKVLGEMKASLKGVMGSLVEDELKRLYGPATEQAE